MNRKENIKQPTRKCSKNNTFNNLEKKNKWHVSTEGKQTEATRLKYTTTTAKQNISRERIQFSSTYTIHTFNNNSKKQTEEL